MITIDSIRAAIVAADPYAEMDRVVQGELAAGRLVKDVFEDIRPHVEQLLDMPGMTEDGEEAFLGTLDALTGNCRADLVYRNPPSLPTEDEIAKLPRWARVAFAARCARRVLPLFLTNRPFPSENRYSAQDPQWSLSQAELSAATASSRVTSVSGYTEAASHIYEDENPADEAAHNSANSAAYAAADAGDNSRPLRTFFAMNYAARAAQGSARLFAVCRRDFDLLTRLASTYGWTDDTPVPPEVFGPLWPEGKPAGWPDDPELPKRTDIALEAVASERATETMIEDEVVNLFLAMNRFHIARTGHPLTVEDFHPFLAARVIAGV